MSPSPSYKSVRLFEKALTNWFFMMIEQRSSAHHQETIQTTNSLSEQSNNENNNPSSDFLSSPIKKRPIYSATNTNGMVVASNAEATPTGATLQKHPNQTTTTALMTNGDDVRVQPSSSETAKQQQQQIQQQIQKICSRCACLASCAWHKSKTTPNASLCETCYRVEALELVDKKCHSCETTKTSRQWYKSKITVGDLCKRCYRIELVALQHKTCIACSSKTTSGHWYKSKLLPDGDLWNNCYGKVSFASSEFRVSFSSEARFFFLSLPFNFKALTT